MAINELEAALNANKFKLVTVTHVDTSTGVLTDVEVLNNVEVLELNMRMLKQCFFLLGYRQNCKKNSARYSSDFGRCLRRRW